MHRPDLAFRACLILVLGLATFLLGYPAAFLASHGLDIRAWPALPGTPIAWFTPEGSGSGAWLALLVRMGRTYLNMVLGRSQALPGGGREAFGIVWGAAVALGVLILMGGPLVPLRHRLRRFGDADFASPRALARMRKGIELGLDPRTNQAVRVQVEGNLLTIAPPRSGKTSGLILPNLAFPERGAWAGPAVVIDPKGDVVRAVRRRRESMGQRVYVLDPLNLAGGTDRWDPLLGLDPEDVLELQSGVRT